MQCPICGKEMSESIERVPANHFKGVKKRTLRTKTKLTRVYSCCSKRYIVAKILKEIA